MKDQIRGKKIKKARAMKMVSEDISFDCHRLKTLIGRAPFCDIQLSNKDVSVLHAQISYDFDGSVWIRDLGSSNGLFVNNAQVSISEINIGDMINIGSYAFKLEDSGSFVDLQKIRENTTLELELSEVQRKLKIKSSVKPKIKGTEHPSGLKYFEDADDFFKRFEDESWRQYYVDFSDNYVDLKNYKAHVMQNIFHEEQQKESLIIENGTGKSIEITCTSADVIHSVDYMDTNLSEIKIGGFQDKNTIHIPTFETDKSEGFLRRKDDRWVVDKGSERDAVYLKGESLSKDTFLVSEDSLIRVRKNHVDIFIRLAQQAPVLDRSNDKDSLLFQSFLTSLVFTLLLFFSLKNVSYIKEEKKEKKVVAIVYKKPKQVQKAKTESVAKQKNAAPQKPPPSKKVTPQKKVVKKTPQRKVLKQAKPKFKLKFSTRKGGSFQKRSFNNVADKSPARKKSFTFVKSKDVKIAGGGRKPSSVSFGSGGTNKRAKFGGGGGNDLASFSTRTVIMGSMDPNAVRKILQRYLPQFRHCYQRELDLNSESVEGVMDLNFTIGKDGRVTKSKLRSRSKFSASGRNCMVRVLQKIQFPKPKGGGIVDIRQPLNFASSGK